MDSWGGRKGFLSSLSASPFFRLHPPLVRDALRPLTDRQTLQITSLSVRQGSRADGNHRCIHVRSQVLPWNKASQTLISQHPSIPVVSVLFFTECRFFLPFRSAHLPSSLFIYRGVRVKETSPVIAQHPGAAGCMGPCGLTNAPRIFHFLNVAQRGDDM